LEIRNFGKYCIANDAEIVVVPGAIHFGAAKLVA